jgi:hypothetical protein
MNELDRILDQLVVDAPQERADWNDVLARSRRRRRGRLGGVALAVAVVAVAVATPAFGVGSRLLDLVTGGTPVSTSQLSDQDLRIVSAMVTGVAPSEIPASKQDELAAIGGTAIRRIAERDGRAYFVIDKSDGSHCFAVGDVGAADLFGAIACQRSPSFPSPEQPILDMSVFHGTMQQGMPTLWRLEGFAADGVANVAVVTADGNLAAVTPVIDNVYVAQGGALPDAPVREIVALAGDGTRLYSECLLAGPGRTC